MLRPGFNIALALRRLRLAPTPWPCGTSANGMRPPASAASPCGGRLSPRPTSPRRQALLRRPEHSLLLSELASRLPPSEPPGLDEVDSASLKSSAYFQATQPRAGFANRRQHSGCSDVNLRYNGSRPANGRPFAAVLANQATAGTRPFTPVRRVIPRSSAIAANPSPPTITALTSNPTSFTIDAPVRPASPCSMSPSSPTISAPMDPMATQRPVVPRESHLPGRRAPRPRPPSRPVRPVTRPPLTASLIVYIAGGWLFILALHRCPLARARERRRKYDVHERVRSWQTSHRTVPHDHHPFPPCAFPSAAVAPTCASITTGEHGRFLVAAMPST